MQLHFFKDWPQNRKLQTICGLCPTPWDQRYSPQVWLKQNLSLDLAKMLATIQGVDSTDSINQNVLSQIAGRTRNIDSNSIFRAHMSEQRYPCQCA